MLQSKLVNFILGYGFLSESYEFSELCAKNGIIFIGPPWKAIRF
jgi:3-methylcrotonyl-CoA carboxylase alpha subunit